MRKRQRITFLLYSLFVLSGSVYGLGEKIITLGADSSWADMEKRQGITEVSSVRPNPVLALASAGTALSGQEHIRENSREFGLDLHLSFDEALPQRYADSQGRYSVSVSAGVAAALAPWSRIGTGAALFTGERAEKSPIVIKPEGNALFAPGSHVRDFSIEFWIFPQSMDNSAQILSWNASKPDGQGGFIYQQIHCVVSKSRLQWTFENFFFSPDETGRKSLVISGPPVLPLAWSHHLIRFDADLGLLEYLVDGMLEALDYTTSSGREGGEAYTPVIGEDCSLALGNRFSGMMDEFRIYGYYLQSPALTRYPPQGGRVETRTLDLGHTNSRLLRIDAFGGRTAAASGKVRNEYAGNGNLNFQDHSQIRFFARVNDSPYRWENIPWVPVISGADLSLQFPGRYVQIAADFYPGADGETSPYLAELRIAYNAEEPPPPPSQIAAIPRDGAVDLSWRVSSSRETTGYLIYYGTAKGEYFGSSVVLASSHAPPPASPVDVGSRTSIRIEGLNNGTLYYFAVAAYALPAAGAANQSYAGPSFIPEPGEFSREVAARPLRMAE